MMLLHRWAVAGVLGAVTLSAISAGQSPAARSATKPAPKIVQPDDGPPPDQAQQPDQAVPLDPAIPPEPPAPAMPAPVVEEEAPAPAAAPPRREQPVATIAPAPLVKPAPEPEPVAATPEQRQLQKDADHLLQLVQDLKLEVDKAGSNTLSLEAVRKADEVQRLSKSLRERVRQWGQPTPGK